MILINDGSFTQNLNSLTGKSITSQITNKLSHTLIDKINFRCVWLKDHHNNKLAYAKSLWLIQPDGYTIFNKDIPIGQSFIKSQIEIYKDLQEIFYGYCEYLEKEFHTQGPIWGRKYTIYHDKKSLGTIQEFFSPHIINLLQK